MRLHTKWLLYQTGSTGMIMARSSYLRIQRLAFKLPDLVMTDPCSFLDWFQLERLENSD
jgi:hypothetical protein